MDDSKKVKERIKQVIIDNVGFVKTEITICEGESLIFGIALRSNSTEEETQQTNEELSERDMSLLEKASILQVVHDEIDNKYYPVINGYETGPLNSNYTIRFKLKGVYLFKLVNHPNNPPPIKIKVLDEQPSLINVTEDGFFPRIIRIDEGTSIKWEWKNLALPHSIYEADYCDLHGGVYRTSKELVRPSSSCIYTRKFDVPGIYYFQTEASNLQQMNCCIIQVKKSYREYSIDIYDKEFSPVRLSIEEGDKVWFQWNSKKVIKRHCVYQIHPPTPDHPENQPYIAVKNGFRWNTPTRNGMFSVTFDRCGVYYYSDVVGKDLTNNIGIIAVKKKPEHHIFRLNEEKKSFEKEVFTVETGDLIWWEWKKFSTAMITLKEASLVYDKKMNTEKCSFFGTCIQLEKDALLKAGIYSYRVKRPGCYSFLFKNDENNCEIITILATAAPKDHKLIVTDVEGIPNILNIHPEDRVWFMWDNAKRPHNIRQVNHQNQIITDGFLSGALMESPATFVQSFDELGIFYYRSDNSQGILGAIVCVPEPKIEIVSVNETIINPDPVIINLNDVVVWEFERRQIKDLVLITSDDDLKNYNQIARDILPSRFISKAFKEPGVFHFMSPSFDKALKIENSHNHNIISTVIVDVFEEHTTVYVDKDGFYPELVNVELGKSVLFDWRYTNQAHNIVHVKLPNDRKSALRAVEGPAAFNSGSKVLNNSFLHTFEEEGMYCVVSDGADYTYCVIKVVRTSKKTKTPKLVKEEPYCVYKYHKIYLECNTKNSKIYYTTDGSTPNKRSMLYDPENGVVFRDEGLNIIRAIAYSEKYLTSEIFTSSRFLVVPDPKARIKEKVSTPNMEIGNKEWWQCIPRISHTWKNITCFELNWTRPGHASQELISHYQLFLNKVSYKNYIKASTNKVYVRGLAGGRNYEVTLVCYPKKDNLVPQESNTLQLEVPRKTELGGPVISLKANSQRHQFTICWLSIETSSTPVLRYDVLVNSERRQKINPIHGKHKVVIDGCKEDTKYSVIVVGIPENDLNPLVSNEIEVTLPLFVSEIKLPEQKLRKLDSDYYDEYIEYLEYKDPKPLPPKLLVRSVGLYSATLEWVPEPFYRPELIIGYRLLIDEDFDKTFEPNVREFMFTNMKPGQKYNVQIMTLTKDLSSVLSNKITLVCPLVPSPPSISKIQSLRPNSATVGWKLTEPRSINGWDNVSGFQVYLNGSYHGEIPAGGLKTFTYLVPDLVEGTSYNVSVQSWCGEKIKEPVDGPIVSCLVSSDFSNTLSLVPAAPPDPPFLRIISMSPDGIELTWDFPQEYGDAYVSGFQVVKDGGCYGEIIPPNQLTTLVGDCEIGETVRLQMISLTNHPCGKYVPYQDDAKLAREKFEKEEVYHLDYPACKPGPMLTVHFTHLVKPAVKIWSENVTAHSAMIIYQIGKTDHHWVNSDYYMISYWSGKKEEANIQTVKTQKDFIQINDLEPNTEYSVQVESRGEASRYYDYYNTDYRYILYSRSNIWKFRTDSPLGPITHLKLAGTICHALKIKWTPPIDPGSELVAQRIDCVSMNPEKPLHVFKELQPTIKTCILDNLEDKTEYRLTVTAITENFLAKHPKIRETKLLPKDLTATLPKATIEATTSGCDAAYNLSYKMKTEDTLLIKWRRPKTYGSTRLIYQILCYHNTNEVSTIQVPLPMKTKTFELQNLKTNNQYKIWVEAVCVVKLNIDSDDMKVVEFRLNQLINNRQIFSTNLDHYKELKEYRCANILSEALSVRI